jgi:hypothetical protein
MLRIQKDIMISIRVDDLTENTCDTCVHRMNEECGVSGREIYSGDPACDYYAEH